MFKQSSEVMAGSTLDATSRQESSNPNSEVPCENLEPHSTLEAPLLSLFNQVLTRVPLIYLQHVGPSHLLFCSFISVFSFSFWERPIIPSSIMDTRAAIPVSLPRANPTTSYWQDPPDPQISDYLSSSSVPEIADLVVIGSGITGAGIAWNSLSGGDGVQTRGNQEKVVMLEARQACSGATGRNGTYYPLLYYPASISSS